MDLEEELDEIEDLEMLKDDEKDDIYYQKTNYLKKWFLQFCNFLKKLNKDK